MLRTHFTIFYYLSCYLLIWRCLKESHLICCLADLEMVSEDMITPVVEPLRVLRTKASAEDTAKRKEEALNILSSQLDGLSFEDNDLEKLAVKPGIT